MKDHTLFLKVESDEYADHPPRVARVPLVEYGVTRIEERRRWFLEKKKLDQNARADLYEWGVWWCTDLDVMADPEAEETLSLHTQLEDTYVLLPTRDNEEPECEACEVRVECDDLHISADGFWFSAVNEFTNESYTTDRITWEEFDKIKETIGYGIETD